jgi:VanZ family protein
MEKPLKRMNVWIACGAGFVVLVIYLSLTSHPIDAPVWMNFKIGHILAYAWLMFWFDQLYPRSRHRIAIGIALFLMGVALEYVQGMVGRDFHYSDMRDDAIGVFLGWVTVMTPLGRSLAVVESRLPR